MKIGILTLPLNVNYGGILQAFALQTTLVKMGHEVVVFDNKFVPCYKRVWYKQCLILLLRLLKSLVKPNVTVFEEKKIKKEYPKLTSNLSRFVEVHLSLEYVQRISSIDVSKYDAIVVGSDQVWRPQYIRSMWNSPVKDAFLCFTTSFEIKRISYAASFGDENWIGNDKKEMSCIASLLQKFDAISVREDTSVSICEKYFGVRPKLVLDPTLLLSGEHYKKLIKDIPFKGKGKILSYILDENEEKLSLINDIASARGLTEIKINMDFSNSVLPINKRILPSVEEWLACFRDAEFVVTDSFHACVFSIIFQKPFIVIANKARGLSRFTSLLSLLNLQSHLLFAPSDYDSNSDYNVSNECMGKLMHLRKESLDFLVNSLKE